VTPLVERPSVRLGAQMTGPDDAPVLVLADSLGTTKEMWDDLVGLLVPHCRVVRFELRGHGGTASPPGPYEISDLGDDLLALLDDLGLVRVHLAGLSIGGMIALWVAANAPARVDRLILCCTSAQLGPPERWSTRARTVLADGMGAVVDPVVERWFTPGFATTHPDRVAHMKALFTAADPIGYAGCCGAIERMDLRHDLARIRSKTLVVAAAEDTAIPPSHGALIAEGIADARFVVVSDAAHIAPV